MSGSSVDPVPDPFIDDETEAAMVELAKALEESEEQPSPNYPGVSEDEPDPNVVTENPSPAVEEGSPAADYDSEGDLTDASETFINGGADRDTWPS